MSFCCWGGWYSVLCVLASFGFRENYSIHLLSLPPPPPPHTHTPSLLPESSNNANSSRCLSSDPVSANPRKRNSVTDKGPRVRTVLSEQQLQTLRTVYASNPRPDALLKEHLVELTGLNPRVIRVWFQNKRCKDKKKAIQAEAIARQQAQQPKQALPQGKVVGNISCYVCL